MSRKTLTVFGEVAALVAIICWICGPSNVWRFARDPLHPSSSSLDWSEVALPEAAKDYLAQYVASGANDRVDPSLTRVAGNEPKPVEAPAADDFLVVETTQETIQDGTTAQWDGAGSNYQVPRYVTRKYLKITSKTDAIIVKRVEINRGNCEGLVSESLLKPFSLKFGQSTRFWIECDPIEAKVQTDRGMYIFTW